MKTYLLLSLTDLRGGDSLCVSKHRRGWQKCLEEHCAELKGHRVVWRKDADPYRLKLVRSPIRARQAEQTASTTDSSL